ncbi:DUF4297 family anti-phage-associated protein [Phaeobacter inhibens]|uniref:DUF4297 domain-containing protein n=1 Tax=Phaeobacter inhibens TaxID=221822 RepID=A0A2I7KG13_9RHOB|nr:DUF4297 family anti-phage-associated protein [Phaeobacter inhibens]AUR01501.1 hypothetical protein PhaeoP88_04189 [Phaeobacter inhibens]
MLSLTDRSAVSTIRGYFYQFDRSILSVLDLAEDQESVSLECIEDIDVQTATDTTAVQCKYYEKTEYNHSVIKPAISFMLSHFKEGLTDGQPSIKYKLSGYFESGQDKLILPLDIEFLKEHFLTKATKGVTVRQHEQLKVSDLELNTFLEALSIDVHAARFEEQFEAIIDALAKQFDCSPFAAEFFYYNNALRVIKELSIQNDEALRIITKGEFLKRIETSSILFEEWFVAKRGKARYYQRLRNEYFINGLNVSSAERLFIVHVSKDSYQRVDVKDLLKTISRKYSKLSKREARPFSPYTLLCGIDDKEILALKQELRNEGFRFLDGYDFKDAAFDRNSISRTASFENGPELRIFSCLAEAQQTFQSFLRSREIYEFYGTRPVSGFGDDAIKHTRFQIPDHKDIKNII